MRQSVSPDKFFTAAQQDRLSELMNRWRAANDCGTALPSKDQAELENLIESELRAAGERAASIAREGGW